MENKRENLVDAVGYITTKYPNKDTLDELLYTAEQTGLIEPMDVDDAMFIYKLVKLARTYKDEPLDENLRM